VWHVFVDFEVKYGDVAQARQLLERVVNVKMSVKKAKAFFKKWLAFEAEHGDDAGQERVKALARAFVERL
jgi:rRNA biogenesis protein RRP5